MVELSDHCFSSFAHILVRSSAERTTLAIPGFRYSTVTADLAAQIGSDPILRSLAEARMFSKVIRLLGSILGIVLLSMPLGAQTTTGRILGAVTDQSGAALTGATVVITDVQRGVTRTITTDQAGEYVAPDLTPGIYKLRDQAPGFESVERTDI